MNEPPPTLSYRDGADDRASPRPISFAAGAMAGLAGTVVLGVQVAVTAAPGNAEPVRLAWAAGCIALVDVVAWVFFLMMWPRRVRQPFTAGLTAGVGVGAALVSVGTVATA